MNNIILHTALLHCPVGKAFEMFTQNENLENWLANKADVVARQGGKYELFWTPSDPQKNNTMGCKVLAADPPNFIHFEWKGPVQFEHIMNTSSQLTNVTVIFTSNGQRTKVSLIHSGWKKNHEWQQAREFFMNAWTKAFEKLEDLINE